MKYWRDEEALLRAASVEEQRILFAKWVQDLVLDMGCTCYEAEKFLAVPFAEFLKAGYESFERPRLPRGTCCELMHCDRWLDSSQ
jgi:hypothetical protein